MFDHGFEFNRVILTICYLKLLSYLPAYKVFYLVMNLTGVREHALEANTKAALEDVGHNTDLYIANQEDNTQN